MNSRICLIIPFYNEEMRFQFNEINALLLIPELHILLVDDGSTDGLPFQILNRYHFENRVSLISTNQNVGKAEAIRKGLNSINWNLFDLVGFADADFAAPSKTIIDLCEIADRSLNGVVHGVRVNNSRNVINAKRYRKAQGILFQYVVKILFNLPITDTQCGLKLYRTRILRNAELSHPFINPWLIDLELLLRCKKADFRILECPLIYWTHIKKSKISIRSIVSIPLSLLKLRKRYGNLKEIKVERQTV